MANVANGDYEDDGGAHLHRHKPPQRPQEAPARVGYAHQADANAALDGHRAGGIEEFGNVKYLKLLLLFYFLYQPSPQKKNSRANGKEDTKRGCSGSTNFCSLHDGSFCEVFGKAASAVVG